MKRMIAIILCLALILSGCSSTIPSTGGQNSTSSVQSEEVSKSGSISNNEEVKKTVSDITIKAPAEVSFSGMDDEKLISYVENTVYSDLVSTLSSDDYFVDNVKAVYVSNEYIEELTYNSQSNIYFGYTLDDLNKQFQGSRYIFTIDDNGKTEARKMETFYDDSTEQIIKNVAIGGGVILICVTVSAVSASVGAPAVSMIFAASAKTGTAFALSSGAISGMAAAITTGYQTGDLDEAIKAGAIESSEGFKWGAISGVVVGGGKAAVALHGATLNGLTMNEAALIQQKTKWPLDAIKALNSTEEAAIYENADLVPTKMANGDWAFLRQIDWNQVDSMGYSNIVRVRDNGLAPVDSTGMPYELHHIGMQSDSPLAILEYSEHHSKSNFNILHYKNEGKDISASAWQKQKNIFWNEVLDMTQSGGAK